MEDERTEACVGGAHRVIFINVTFGCDLYMCDVGVEHELDSPTPPLPQSYVPITSFMIDSALNCCMPHHNWRHIIPINMYCALSWIEFHCHRMWKMMETLIKNEHIYRSFCHRAVQLTMTDGCSDTTWQYYYYYFYLKEGWNHHPWGSIHEQNNPIQIW